MGRMVGANLKVTAQWIQNTQRIIGSKCIDSSV
jgi:hypothetical protein